MIKSYFLNNLFVPLRQVSPSMLLASAALHSLLFAVPIPFNSTDAELIKSANSTDEDNTKSSKDICDEYNSSKGAGEDSFDEEILGGVGEDSLGEDSLGEDASLAEGAGEDSLGEDDSLAEGAGEDSFLAEGAGEDSLSEEIPEGVGEDSLSEEIPEGVEGDSLTEEIPEGAEGDSLTEEIPEDNTTPDLKELCEDESLPKGKGLKVPKETPLLGNLENGDSSEEIGDGEDAIPDLANGDSDDSFDESGDAIDEIPTPTDDFSAGEDGISSEELPTPSGDISLVEPESEPEIAFTPSQSDDEFGDDSIPQEVDEPGEDSLSEGVDEPGEDSVPEGVDEPGEDSVPEEVDEPGEDSVPEGVDEPGEGSVPEEVDEPEETTDTQSNPEETAPETDNQPKTRPVDPFAEFPNYSNVKPNFCGVRSAKIDRRTRVTSDRLDSVQAYFEKKLANTDFQVEKLTDRPDTKVYQVSRGNLTQFLQLFATEKQGTMILLSSRRVDCYRLSDESLPEKPESKTEQQTFDAAFQNLYAQLGWTEEKEFATTSEVEKIFGKDTKNSPNELALLVKTKLESEGFEASQINEEASPLLYEVKKGEFTKYISFVPTTEGKGAIVLALKDLPA